MAGPFQYLLKICLRHVCIAFLLIAGLVGGAGLAKAADEFCPVPPAPITIHNKVPVIKDSNIKDFAATNSLTRYGTIVELGDLGVEIARAAALGKYITGLDVDRKSFYTIIDAEKGLSVFRPGTGECYGFKPGSPDEGLLVCVR